MAEYLPLLPNLPVEFSDADLDAICAQESVEDINYEDCRFQDQDVSYAQGVSLEFEGCILRRCTLRGMNFKSVSFKDCVLENCDLSNARIGALYMQRVQMLGCKLVGADMPKSQLRNVVIRDCLARYINLNASKLHTVTIIQSDLSEGALQSLVLQKLRLDGCNFTRAELLNTSLADIDLTSCVLDGILLSGYTELSKAIVSPLQAVLLCTLLGVVVKQE